MYPHLFGLRFPPTFGLLVVLGFLLGTHVHAKLVNQAASDREREGYAALPVWVLLGIMLGARLMYVIVEIARDSEQGQAYLSNPVEILKYWEGGLVMYGGAFGAIVAAALCVRKYGLPLAYTIDTGAIACFAGLGVGRIGCLMVGDDFGQVVPDSLRELPFPITIEVPYLDPPRVIESLEPVFRDGQQLFENGEPVMRTVQDTSRLPAGSLFGEHNAGQVLWNTQVWMSANAFMIAKIGHAIFKRRRYAGQAALWMFVIYAVMRSLIETMRGDSVRGLWFGDTLSTSQLISIAFGLICVALLFLNRGRFDADHEGPEAQSAKAGGES